MRRKKKIELKFPLFFHKKIYYAQRYSLQITISHDIISQSQKKKKLMIFNLFKKFKKPKDKALTEEEGNLDKLWDLWELGKVDSPYYELMTYQSEVNNGGHSQYFFNLSNTDEDIDKAMSLLCEILSEKLSENLKTAYDAYQKLDADEDNPEYDDILDDCDDVFYENEDEINSILEKFAENIKLD